MRSRLRSQLAWSVGGVLLVALGGCSFGAKALHSNRPEYNKAIHRTEKEQLLLNIIRLRYAEPIKFLQVASIVSSFSYGAGVDAGAVIPIGSTQASRGPNVVNIGGR
jgi:hypothetical protein